MACRSRGREIEPSLAIDDGALDFWKDARQIWLDCEGQLRLLHTMPARALIGPIRKRSDRRDASATDDA